MPCACANGRVRRRVPPTLASRHPSAMLRAVTSTPDPGDARAWKRVGLLLLAVGWGANHFVPLLLVYRQRLGLDAAAPAMLFVMYALGLVPGLRVARRVRERSRPGAVARRARSLAL